MGQIMRPSDIRRAVSEWVAQGFAVTVQPDGTITINPPPYSLTMLTANS